MPRPAHPADQDEKPDLFTLILASPLLWGVLLTVGCYMALPSLPMYRDLATRYLCGHPIEYVTVGLFFVGMAILGVKGLQVPQEKQAFQFEMLRDPAMRNEANAEARRELLLARIESLPPHLRRTELIRRYRDAIQYLAARKSSDALEEHLKYLAELAAERVHDSYGLVRTVTWAVPILGFLGTVMGITIAIANVTPDQLDTSLPEVTGGLAIAFDTTAVSLTLSLILVFTAFVVERMEQQILSRVERAGLRDLAEVFPPESAGGTPLAEAQGEAAARLLAQTETMVERQVELWQKSLESLRGRWQQTLEQQQARLAATLESGLDTTLADHAEHLRGVRQELLDAHRQLTQDSAGVVAELQHTALAQQQAALVQSQELKGVHEALLGQL